MNTQYKKNKELIKDRTKYNRALHIAQSLWRAWWRGKIQHPLNLKDLYETTLALGIETLPKVDHDGIYEGRRCSFPEYGIKKHLEELNQAEPEERHE